MTNAKSELSVASGARASYRLPERSDWTDAGAGAGATTISNCTYTLGTPTAHSARLTLMWASSAKLMETNDYYIKRHKELSRIKGDVLVLASVTRVNGAGQLDFIEAESQVLMAAALKKL